MAKNHVKFKCKCGAIHHLKVVDGEMKHEVEYARKPKEDEQDTPTSSKTKVKNDRNLVADFIQGTGPFADEDENDDGDEGAENLDDEGEQ